jgi:hypothetical protein
MSLQGYTAPESDKNGLVLGSRRKAYYITYWFAYFECINGLSTHIALCIILPHVVRCDRTLAYPYGALIPFTPKFGGHQSAIFWFCV